MSIMGCNTIEITYFPMFIAAAVLNALGIYLLFKDTNCKTNQNLMLKYLSTVELALACLLMADLSFTCHSTKSGNIDIQVLLPMIRSFFFNITLIMCIMTFDRIIATKYPIRYITMMTSKKVKVILFSTTLLCIILGVLLSVLQARKFNVIYHINIFRILNVVSALFIIISYIYIFSLLLRRKQFSNSSQNSRMRRSAENRRFLKMAAVITLTYFVCYSLSYIIILSNVDFHTNNLDALRIPLNLGLVVDPITYIFMQKRLRASLMKLMVCCCYNKNELDNARRQKHIATINEDRQRETVLETTL